MDFDEEKVKADTASTFGLQINKQNKLKILSKTKSTKERLEGSVRRNATIIDKATLEGLTPVDKGMSKGTKMPPQSQQSDNVNKNILQD